MSKIARSLVVLTGVLTFTFANAQHAELMNKADPLPGVTTAGQPDQAALKDLADAGYVAVIDLRAPNENRGFDEKQAVEGLGMSYLPLPINGGKDITYENASALDKLLAGIDGPVLLHCASSNRVGALLALRDKMKGASTEEALTLGDSAGLKSLRPIVEEQLGKE